MKLSGLKPGVSIRLLGEISPKQKTLRYPGDHRLILTHSSPPLKGRGFLRRRIKLNSYRILFFALKAEKGDSHAKAF
jgi:hypothetical protein